MKPTTSLLFICLFLLAGIGSTLLFQQGDMAPALVLGLLFIIPAALCSLVGKHPTTAQLLKFIGFSYAVYLAIFFATLFCFGLAVVIGIVTGAVGAWFIFWAYNKFLSPITYDTSYVMIVGALAFTINDLLMFTPFQNYFPRDYKGDISYSFSLIYLFWQFFVGLKLVLTIRKSNAPVTPEA